MLHSVTIRRFKSLTEVTLPLSRVTALIGSNNAGKSSTLQAIQFGVSAIQSIALESKSLNRGEVKGGTLAADQLVYSPLRDVHTLAQGGRLREAADHQIEVEFDSDDGGALVAVKRGKNKNLTISISGDRALVDELKDLLSPFSVIAPGLAGIPSIEEYKSPGIVRRAAARGDANSVFRNVLWILKEDAARWKKFQDRMGRIFPDVEVEVAFDPSSDEYITATVTREGAKLPIDAAGTGILQAAQILSYVGVYHPRLLILDEPDSHLHPDNQRKLIRLLDEVAHEDDFQVLLSTHSRHMLDECIGLGALTHWMTSGSLQDEDAQWVSMLLSLGALDIGDRLRGGAVGLVVLTEDTKPGPLRVLLAANGIDMSKTQIWPYDGCTNLNAARVLAKVIDDMAPGCRIAIHRDRDYLDDGEVEELQVQVESAGFELFVTESVDVEAYFLRMGHLTHVFSDRETAEIEAILERATSEVEEDSMKIMTDAWYQAKFKTWPRGRGPFPVGEMAQRARDAYRADPSRYRHGKRTLKAFRRLAASEWGVQKEVMTPSVALRDPQLVNLAEKM